MVATLLRPLALGCYHNLNFTAFLKQTQDLYLQDPGSDNAETTNPTSLLQTLLCHLPRLREPGNHSLKKEKK